MSIFDELVGRTIVAVEVMKWPSSDDDEVGTLTLVLDDGRRARLDPTGMEAEGVAISFKENP